MDKIVGATHMLSFAPCAHAVVVARFAWNVRSAAIIDKKLTQIARTLLRDAGVDVLAEQAHRSGQQKGPTRKKKKQR